MRLVGEVKLFMDYSVFHNNYDRYEFKDKLWMNLLREACLSANRLEERIDNVEIFRIDNPIQNGVDYKVSFYQLEALPGKAYDKPE